MKRLFYIFICVMLSLSCCGDVKPDSNEILFCSDDSYLIDYYVDADNVHIICVVVLENRSNNDITVTINARSQEDVTTGLLTNADLTGFNSESSNQFFTVPAEKKQEYIIDFYGEYGGTNQKYDRLIPDELVVSIVTK